MSILSGRGSGLLYDIQPVVPSSHCKSVLVIESVPVIQRTGIPIGWKFQSWLCVGVSYTFLEADGHVFPFCL